MRPPGSTSDLSRSACDAEGRIEDEATPATISSNIACHHPDYGTKRGSRYSDSLAESGSTGKTVSPVFSINLT